MHDLKEFYKVEWMDPWTVPGRRKIWQSLYYRWMSSVVQRMSEANLGKGTRCVVLQFSQKIVLFLQMMVLPEQEKHTLCFCIWWFILLFFFCSSFKLQITTLYKTQWHVPQSFAYVRNSLIKSNCRCKLSWISCRYKPGSHLVHLLVFFLSFWWCTSDICKVVS